MINKKILYVTTSRADYWIMRKLLLSLSKKIDLDILVSGMHLSKKYGLTINDVRNDFKNAYTLSCNPNKNKNKYDVINTMSILQKKFNKFLEKNKYDFIILLGDRTEILPFAICASILNIPIIHLHGGEITYGAYDEFVRHCITKMSSLHLTSTEKYKKRIIQMGENNVYNIGSLGSLNAHNFKYIKNIVPYKKYFVILFHPETINDNQDEINELIIAIDFFKQKKINFVFIGCNNDVGGNKYNEIIKEYCKKNNFIYFSSLKSDEYFSLVKDSIGLIGNSSSGIIEVPCLCKNIINIGNRQKGREKSRNIINVKCEHNQIIKAIKKIIESNNEVKHINPYCNLNALDAAEEIIIKFINNYKKKYKIFKDIRFKH